MNNWFKKKISSPVITFWGRKKESRHFSKPPIFIGGCGRSGTTLLLSMLSAHPKIFCIPYETDAFTKWKVKSGKFYPTRIDRLYRALLRYSLPKEVHRWCEKRPANVLYIGQILEFYPNASFIHIVRDPRAVCTSIHPSAPNKYWISTERYITDLKAGMRYFEHPRVLTIQYENLILNKGEMIRKICEFIQEDYVPQLDDWVVNATVRKNKAWEHEVKEVEMDSLYKWQNISHKEQIKLIELDPEIRRIAQFFGYRLNKLSIE